MSESVVTERVGQIGHMRAEVWAFPGQGQTLIELIAHMVNDLGNAVLAVDLDNNCVLVGFGEGPV